MKKLLLAILLFASQAHATTYWVSTSGNDANSCATASGTMALTTNAKRNINGASGALACLTTAGDILYARTGSYPAHFFENKTSGGLPLGTTNAHITISAYNGEVVTFTVAGGSSAIWDINDYNTVGHPISYYIDVIGIDHNCSGAGDLNCVGGIEYQYITWTDCSFHGSATASGANPHGNHLQFINADMYSNGDSALDHGLYMIGHDNVVDGGSYHSNSGYGIQIYDSGSAAVSDNTVKNARIYSNDTLNAGAGGIVISSGYNNRLYNNLVYNNNERGIDIGSGESHDLHIYNNSVYGNASDCIKIGEGSSATIIKNNICYLNGTDRIVDFGSSTSCAKNLIGGSGGCDVLGIDANITGSNPQFSNAGGAVFTIASTSAAKDVGLTLTDFAVDITGAGRPFGPAWDIGAYEYGASPPASNDGHYAKVTFKSLATAADGTTSMGPIIWVTSDTDGDRDYYGCILYTLDGMTYRTTLYGIQNGALIIQLTADTSTTWTNTDTFGIDITAGDNPPATISCNKNGTQIGALTTTDSTLANSGAAYGFAVDGDSDAVISVWEGGTITGGTRAATNTFTFVGCVTTGALGATADGWTQINPAGEYAYYSGSGGGTSHPRSGDGLNFAVVKRTGTGTCPTVASSTPTRRGFVAGRRVTR